MKTYHVVRIETEVYKRINKLLIKAAKLGRFRVLSSGQPRLTMSNLVDEALDCLEKSLDKEAKQ